MIIQSDIFIFERLRHMLKMNVQQNIKISNKTWVQKKRPNQNLWIFNFFRYDAYLGAAGDWQELCYR